MNLSKASSLNELLTKLLIEELHRNKINTYFISPGSRSTPLTSTVAINFNLNKHIHFDERGAAFSALGYARATGKPAVLICTSGSAGANYFPAICEAYADSIPIIILTADRPPELHEVLANQTCNQQNMFGDKVKSFLNIEPLSKKSSLKEILSQFSNLLQQSTAVPSGPVHINLMFREPLAHKKTIKDFNKQTLEIQNWLKSNKPFVKQKTVINKQPISTVFDKNIPTILIAGALKTKKESEALISFAEKYNIPIFPDIRSWLRLSNKSTNVISYYDQLLLSKALQPRNTYQIIHVGGNIVSKRLLQFIEKSHIENYLVLHNSVDPYNPHHKLTDSKSGKIDKLLKELTINIKPFNNKFLKEIIKNNKKIKSTLLQFDYKFTEIAIAREISQATKKNSFIYSANSLSVRLLDIFAETSENNNNVIANRGLSGIDGTIASAVGYSIGSKKRGTLLIGDLALLHDLNSLALLKKSTYPIVIVVLNNNGGKIFSYLPIVKEKDIFSDYFDTPQNLTFESTAKQFDLPYFFISSTRQFKEIYQKAQSENQSTIIEIALQDSELIQEQKQIEKEIKKLF